MRSSPHPSLYSLQPGSCLGSHCGFLGKLVSPGTAHLGVLGEGVPPTILGWPILPICYFLGWPEGSCQENLSR